MIIYKVTNKINGKVYIGKTKYTLNDRKSQHFSECKLYNTHNKFHNALREILNGKLLIELLLKRN